MKVYIFTRYVLKNLVSTFKFSSFKDVAQYVEHKSNEHKRHEKYYHSITFGGHDPLCPKSYKIRYTNKKF